MSRDYQSKLLATPGELVSGGQFNLGVYNEPFRNVNPLDAELRSGVALPRCV